MLQFLCPVSLHMYVFIHILCNTLYTKPVNITSSVSCPRTLDKTKERVVGTTNCSWYVQVKLTLALANNSLGEWGETFWNYTLKLWDLLVSAGR